MSRIDFYSLEPGSRGDRFLLACKLVERIRAKGLRALIFCPDLEQARHLDRLLWTYRDDSFLPHGLVGKVDTDLTPILISTDGRPETEHQVLINLALQPPDFLNRFERVCDLVDQNPEILAAGRVRYRGYRGAGLEPNHHKLKL
ncbi:DNA polymerase III subunit chi [Thiorhodococcus mannitoliphagus]|uniref:DNA polymerase III subunit chi n=1 Tax=Thiorhodococcus mannitoliphagus TaxID=329406 RepID=A0A6P1DQC0_9GAMM|nr:DNA polymerase III subunit chi [Thiorhodococcus mannitoliphagus]NEX20218.1 DNA polymerase III subunit chi [Thiorhodococcus mannitoliphagus]